MTNSIDLDDSGELSFELAEGFQAPEIKEHQRVPTPTAQQWPASAPEHEPATDVVELTDAMLASLAHAPPEPRFAEASHLAVDDAPVLDAVRRAPMPLGFPRELPMALPAFRGEAGPSTNEALQAIQPARPTRWVLAAAIASMLVAVFGWLLWSELASEAPASAPREALVAMALPSPPMLAVPEEDFAPFPEDAADHPAPHRTEPPSTAPTRVAVRPQPVVEETADSARRDAGPPTVRAVARSRAKAAPTPPKPRPQPPPSVDPLDAWQ
jgi:hypothetical protein